MQCSNRFTGVQTAVGDVVVTAENVDVEYSDVQDMV